jgi:hypothetical protein
VIVTGMIGNVLEWYDFAVHCFFSAAIGHAIAGILLGSAVGAARRVKQDRHSPQPTGFMVLDRVDRDSQS